MKYRLFYGRKYTFIIRLRPNATILRANATTFYKRHLRHSSSSELSPQSLSPSHFQGAGIHFSDLQRNCPVLHLKPGDDDSETGDSLEEYPKKDNQHINTH